MSCNIIPEAQKAKTWDLIHETDKNNNEDLLWLTEATALVTADELTRMDVGIVQLAAQPMEWEANMLSDKAAGLDDDADPTEAIAEEHTRLSLLVNERISPPALTLGGERSEPCGFMIVDARNLDF